MEELKNQAWVIIATLICMPWCVWVTVSLFNQRQELALLKQIFEALKSVLGHSFKTDP